MVVAETAPDDECAGYHQFAQCDTSLPFGSFLVYALEPFGWYWIGCYPGEDPADYTDPDLRTMRGPFTSSRVAYNDARLCGR